MKINRAKLIFNPRAGLKRSVLPNPNRISLEDIKRVLKQYQIPVDFFPTKRPGHAIELARNAKKEGYKMVIAAGGDGTVGEVANGLINTEIELGIIPLGSFMNIARMLSIPLDLEKAVMLIKIGRSRKIDMGSITKLGGEKLDQPYYFIESCGMGIEAELHKHVLQFERGEYKNALGVIKTLFSYYGHRAIITIDKQVIKTRATVVTISNGPFSGASIPLAPQARLNDHKLTVRFFKLSKLELMNYIWKAIRGQKSYPYRIETYQAKKVKVETKVERLVHADARLYGRTPVELKIIPSALNVITGFPEDKSDTALIKRTELDP